MGTSQDSQESWHSRGVIASKSGCSRRQCSAVGVLSAGSRRKNRLLRGQKRSSFSTITSFSSWKMVFRYLKGRLLSLRYFFKYNYVCICLYVCVYVCLCICLSVCMYGCMCVCMFAWMYACMHVKHIYIFFFWKKKMLFVSLSLSFAFMCVDGLGRHEVTL